MSVIESIIDWAKNDLPDWQSDAVRRLLISKELTSQDEEEILCMVKDLHGLNEYRNKKNVPRPLKDDDVPGVRKNSRKLTLKAIKNLCNVNAIENGSSLLLGHMGLSVIYGENGAGKSGYARVLKRACKAKDSKEKILSNVYGQGSDGVAEAIFKISINDGTDEEIHWKDGEDIETPLSQITVFDSKSANIIVDGNNEVVYLPQGAHVFQDLVDLLKKLKGRLEEEKPVFSKLKFLDIASETEAGKIIDELKYSTEREKIEAFAEWNDEMQNRLLILHKSIVDAELNDPIKEARKLRNLKERINKILENVKEIQKGFSEEQQLKLEQAIKKVQDTRNAVRVITQDDLTKEPLPGVGENTWQLLYNAAKDYSVSFAYPEKEFPQTEEYSHCVLCMQPLSNEAIDRMLRFKDFMENTTKRQEELAVKALEELSKKIQDLIVPSLESISDIIDEIRDRDKEVAIKLERFIEASITRKKEMLQFISGESISSFTKLRSSTKEDLIRIIEQLEAEALSKEIKVEPDLIRGLKKEKEELEAKKIFMERKKEILNYLEVMKRAHKYDKCINELSTSTITRKGNTIVTSGLTPRFSKALTNELNELGGKHLLLQLKSSGNGGQTRYQIQLQEKQTQKKAKLSEILSEGEQRIVAITGFFSELDLGEHECPIVFDDPVTSLDHRYREKIAERIVTESLKRQVIVFTHDIAFLLALESKVRELQNVYFHVQTVRNNGDYAGNLTDSRPWHAMNVNGRVKFLNTKLEGLRKLYQSENQSYNREAAEFYALLRETWESLIERDLLNETVYRFSVSVQTQRLKAVVVTNEDYQKIDLGMSKCSTWMFGHDKSVPLDANRPNPEELLKDLRELEDFGKSIRKRQKEIQKERNAALRPLVPTIG
jgi:hypothetical protein